MRECTAVLLNQSIFNWYSIEGRELSRSWSDLNQFGLREFAYRRHTYSESAGVPTIVRSGWVLRTTYI